MVFICRLCTKCELTSSGLAIFGEIGTKRLLAYKIKLTVDIVVSQDDPLPKYVCRYCLGRLEETFSFQESCRRAQLQLRDHFLRDCAQLVENDTPVFSSPCDDSGLSSATSTCDTSALSTPAEFEADISPDCQEFGSHVRISMLNPVQTIPETDNAIVPEITAVCTNAEPSLLSYAAANGSASQNMLSSGTLMQVNSIHSSGLNKVQEATGVDSSILEICIKEEQVVLGSDYYEPEGNVYTSDMDVDNRLQRVISNTLSPRSEGVMAHADPAVVEANKGVESAVTEEAPSSPDVLPISTTTNIQAAAPGGSEGGKNEDDIYVVEVVKANKASVAQYWEQFGSHFRCKKCLKVFMRKSKCENHIRTHLGVRPYECWICKQRFRKKRMLNEHAFVHSGKKLYHCIYCSKAFRLKNNFQRHTRKHKEPQVAEHSCEHCGKIFSDQWKYWQHKASKHVLVNADAVVV